MATKQELYTREWTSRLEKRRAEIEALEEKLNQTSAPESFNPPPREFVHLLHKHWQRAHDKLDAMLGGDSDWESHRHDLEQSMKELEARINEGKTRLKEQT